MKYQVPAPVLRWNRTGITIAGIVGQYGNDSNKLNQPYGLDIDWSYTLYIADRYNHRIQKYLRDASFGETVAGKMSGVTGSTSEFLRYPCEVQVDINENVYVDDTDNHRLQLWSRGASNGITIAGTGIKFEYFYHEYY